jgi:hypothetical protein
MSRRKFRTFLIAPLPLLVIVALAVMPAAAQAAPHFYKNGVISPEQTGGPGEEGTDIISWGTLVLTTKTVGVITCLNEFGGDAYNPTGGGNGLGGVDGYTAYDCTNEVCELTFKSKQEIIPEGLEGFGEWETEASEAVAGKKRLRTGNNTLLSPKQIKFLISCPENPVEKLGKIATKSKGELHPLAENGTGIGSAPSKLVFNKEAGELEIANVKEGEVNGTVKIMGYEAGEIIAQKNP